MEALLALCTEETWDELIQNDAVVLAPIHTASFASELLMEESSYTGTITDDIYGAHFQTWGVERSVDASKASHNLKSYNVFSCYSLYPRYRICTLIHPETSNSVMVRICRVALGEATCCFANSETVVPAFWIKHKHGMIRQRINLTPQGYYRQRKIRGTPGRADATLDSIPCYDEHT